MACAIDSSRDLAPVQHVPLLIEARRSGAERISGGLSDKSILQDNRKPFECASLSRLEVHEHVRVQDQVRD